MKILILDDDKAFLDFVSRRLEREGNTVFKCINFECLQKKLSENIVPDVFLIDFDLGVENGNGISIAFDLRHNVLFKDSKIAIITNDASVESKSFYIMKKDMSLDTLMESISDFLKYKGVSQCHPSPILH
jgi:DNA-binding NtrC family response regulator